MVLPGYQGVSRCSALEVALDDPCREASILYHALHGLDGFTASSVCTWTYLVDRSVVVHACVYIVRLSLYCNPGLVLAILAIYVSLIYG